MKPSSRHSRSTIIAVSLGTADYLATWELQKRLHAQVVQGALPSVLLLLEHEHVYTLGRSGTEADILVSPAELAGKGVQVHHVDRGGEVTYHGPGQLVAYPIVSLRDWGGGPLKFVRALERAIVGALGEFGISAESGERPTGVWVGDSKIAAIGVKVSRGVTTHGLALNVDPDLSFFSDIVPCGMPDVHVTSMAVLRPDAPDMPSVRHVLARRLAEAFGWTLDWAGIEELPGRSLAPQRVSSPQ